MNILEIKYLNNGISNIELDYIKNHIEEYKKSNNWEDLKSEVLNK